MTKPWEQYREIIIAEYRDNRKPLHEVKKLMEQQYRFKASYVALPRSFEMW